MTINVIRLPGNKKNHSTKQLSTTIQGYTMPAGNLNLMPDTPFIHNRYKPAEINVLVTVVNKCFPIKKMKYHVVDQRYQQGTAENKVQICTSTIGR